MMCCVPNLTSFVPHFTSFEKFFVMDRIFFNVALFAFIISTMRSGISCSSLDSEIAKSMESNLLLLLKLPERPRIGRHRAFIPPHMVELYEKQRTSEYETVTLPLPGAHTRSANTVRPFFNSDPDADDRSRSDSKVRLYFDISTLPDNEAITGAELRLSVPLSETRGNQENIVYQTIRVSDIIQPGIKGRSKPILRLLDVKEVDIHRSSEVGLDILPAVEKWRRTGSTNFGVIVQVAASDERPAVRLRRRAVDEETDEDWRAVKPVLYIYSDDGRNKRQRIEKLVSRRKRALDRASFSKQRNRHDICKRHPMYIDFNDVGWSDWIVAPSGYDAYFCAGDCPFPLPDHMNTTNHATIQTLVNSVKPNLMPKACCAPTSLEPISMLYLDNDGKTVLKTYADMVVTGCGCI